MVRPLPSFDPAFALAAACALLDDSRLRAVAPGLLARPEFDWERLAKAAFYNQVEQVVRTRLEQVAPGAMPAGFDANIRRASIRTSALQAAQAKAAAHVIGALTAAGIPSVMIKGLALAELLYAPTPELRASNDIDIVIAPENLRAADRILRANGLRRSWPEGEPPEAARPMLLRMASVFNYRGAALNELVELHARPTVNPHWMPVTFADLQAASTEVQLPDGPIRTLDGPLNVHYLCQHALYCRGFRLKWLGDLGRALRRSGAGSCTECVARYLQPLPRRPAQLADEILRSLEEGIEQALSGTDGRIRASADAALIVRHMADTIPIAGGRSLSTLPLELWWHSLVLRHLPGWRGKAHQLLLGLSDPRDAVTLRLGPRFTAVYWLMGPILSLARYIRRGRKRAKATLRPAVGSRAA